MDISLNSRKGVSDACFAFAVFIFIYAYHIFRFSLVPDEMLDVMINDPSIYIPHGRWGLYLFRILTWDTMAPLLSGVFSGVCVAVAIILQIRLLKLERLILKVAFTAFQLGVIQLMYVLCYAFQADVTCFGYMLATLGVLFFERGFSEKRRADMALFSLCELLALSVYQTLLTVPCALFGLICLRGMLSGGMGVAEVWRKAFVFAGGMLAAIAVHKLLMPLFMLLPDDATKAWCACYQQDLILWLRLDWLTTARHVVKEIAMELLGAGYVGSSFLGLGLIPAVGILLQLRKRCCGMEKVTALLIWGAVLIVPYMSIILLGEDYGPRLYVAAPMVNAAWWCLWLSCSGLADKSWCRTLVCALACAVVLKAAYCVTGMAYEAARVQEYETRLSQEITQRAWQTPVPDGVDVYSCPVVVSGGMLPEPKVPRVLLPRHFSGRKKLPFNSWYYTWTGQTSLKSIGDTPLSEERATEALKSMPCYPLKGCCRYVDGVILVKLPLHPEPAE